MIQRIIDHIGTAAILDFLIKLIGDEENLTIQSWLIHENLVPLLITKLDPFQDFEVHRNVSEALIAIITTSSHQQLQATPLLDKLQEETQMTALLNNILLGGTALLYGIQVPIELLKRLNKSIKELLIIPVDIPPILNIILKRLNDFHVVLNTPPNQIITSMGVINPPAGKARIKVIEFFVHLVRTNYEVVALEIIKAEIIKTCLDLFFQLCWNNFLHRIVLDLVQSILEGKSDALRLELLKPENTLIDRILAANSRNDEFLSQPKRNRLGFMGYITIISQAIISAGEKYPETIGSQLKKNENWQRYVDLVLMEIIKVESTILGGSKPTVTNDDSSIQESVFDRIDLDKTPWKGNSTSNNNRF